MAKKETEVTPPVEETTEVVTPPETETQEDLQARLDAAKAEAEQNLELYKGSQRKESKIADRERKQDILDTLPDILDKMNLQQAETWDEIQDLKTQQAGGTGYQEQTYIPQPPQRRADQIRSQQDARKQVSQPKVESEIDPKEAIASIKAQMIIEEMGWDMKHPAVKKTLHEGCTAEEAYDILNKEKKAQKDKEADETVQRKLKDAGVTTPETAGPSGQGTRSYTPAQIAAMPYEEYNANKESIEKAYRAGNIK